MRIPNPFKKKKKQDVVSTRLTYGKVFSAPSDTDRFRSGSFQYLRTRPKTKHKISVPAISLNVLLIAIGFILFVILSVYIFFLGDTFAVKEVTFENGVVPVSLQSELIDTNILRTSVSSYEQRIRESVPNTEYVYVRKIFPDTLQVDLEIIKPVFAIRTFGQVYLVNESLTLKNVTDETTEELVLTEDEQSLIAGLISRDDNLIEEFIINNLEEEEVEDFAWEDVTDEVRQEVLDSLIAEAQGKVQIFRENVLSELRNQYPDLPIVFSQVGVNTVSDIAVMVRLTLNALTAAEEYQFTVNSLEWVSGRSLRVQLEEGSIFYFSQLRSVEDQIRDFGVILQSDILTQGSTFDLRVENITFR